MFNSCFYLLENLFEDGGGVIWSEPDLKTNPAVLMA